MSLILRGIRPLWLQGALATASTCSKRSLSSAANDKLYELRRYKVRPDKYPEFVKNATEKYAELMMPHGKLLGYWASNVGGLNEVHHMWEYENYAHRDEVVRSKREDKRAFEEYIFPALSMVISQEHTLLRAFPWYTPKLEPQKWGAYELVTFSVKPGMMSQLEHRVQWGLPERLAGDYPPALGFWYSVFGNANLFVHMWPHESLDKRDQHRKELFESNEEWRETWRDSMKFINAVDVKGLVSLPFSPLQ